MLNKILALWNKYPARIASAVAAVVVFVAAKLGVVVDQESVVQAILVIVPILFAGEITHRNVTPSDRA